MWFHKCGGKNLIPPRWHRHFLLFMEILFFFFFFLFFFQKIPKVPKVKKVKIPSEKKERKKSDKEKKPRKSSRYVHVLSDVNILPPQIFASEWILLYSVSCSCFSFTFTARLSFLSVNAVFLALIGCIFLYFWGLVDIVVTSLYSSKEPHLFVVQLPFKPALSHITFCEVK